MANVFDQSKESADDSTTESELSKNSGGRYRPNDHQMLKICMDCGVMVSDTEAHDQFHYTIIHSSQRRLTVGQADMMRNY